MSSLTIRRQCQPMRMYPVETMVKAAYTSDFSIPNPPHGRVRQQWELGEPGRPIAPF